MLSAFPVLDNSLHAAFRGKAPTLPLPPLSDELTQAAKLKAIQLAQPEKETKEHLIWGMRSGLVLASLATTLAVGIVMLIAIAFLQPE